MSRPQPQANLQCGNAPMRSVARQFACCVGKEQEPVVVVPSPLDDGEHTALPCELPHLVRLDALDSSVGGKVLHGRPLTPEPESRAAYRGA